jgi:hypothetical protein
MACSSSNGFCLDRSEIRDLILDDAILNEGSLQAILNEARFISNASLVGLSFSDEGPNDLRQLLSIATLTDVRVDHALFDRYADELNTFDAIPGKTVTVAPEPSTVLFCTPAILLLPILFLRSQNSRRQWS